MTIDTRIEVTSSVGKGRDAAEHSDESVSRETVAHDRAGPILRTWTTEKLSPRLTRKLESLASSEDVVRVVVMPDVHEGTSVPNGCIIATKRLIYPEAVGKDIGCGMSAIQFGISADDISRPTLEAILRALKSTVPALKHSRTRSASELPEACPLDGLSDPCLTKVSQREGLLQLGTLGRGNHFVELQRDSNGLLWAMVHSGSRGMGEAITGFHVNRATRSKTSGLSFLDLNDETGQAYYCDMRWATTYATESRLLILNRVADLVERELGAEVISDTYIDCPHNFARVEDHFGEQLIVHRKSANSARDGELGIIPGSMAAGSRIVTGRGSAEALSSSSHGAGRTMSRREAAENIQSKTLAGMMQGIVYQNEHVDQLRDEAPAAYKNLNNVMRAQSDLVRTENILTTLLNYKAL